MRVLIVGGGGREHALAWKIAQSPQVEKLYAAPGNPGIARHAECVELAAGDMDGLLCFARDHEIGLTVVGPEDPLAAGIVDRFEAEGLRIFGPSKAAARLEASKAFAKGIMERHGIPTGAYREFDKADAALAYIREVGAPIVVKADGLAAGKGVTVAHSVEEAELAVRAAMLDGAFGVAGSRVVVEEFLAGEEASIFAFSDGERILPLATSQDHKAVFDGDSGPNTGGMGAYSPAPLVSDALFETIRQQILEPCIRGMAAEGSPYRGVLYAGLMIGAEGPKVIEFNCRFGDPEAEVILPRMKSDLVPLLLACSGGSLEGQHVAWDSRACVTVIMASGGYPGAYPKGVPIHGIEDVEHEGVVVFQAGTGMNDGQLVTNGGRVLAVTALAEGIPNAIEKAYAAVQGIHFEGAHYRTDIGRKALARLGV
jgi:phosphoribosylamine---glycine ligase